MQSTIIFALLFFVSIMKGRAITNKRNHMIMSSFLQTESTLQVEKNNSYTIPYSQKEIKNFFILDYLFSLSKSNNITCNDLLYEIERKISKEKNNETINITEYTCYTIRKKCNVSNCIKKLNETFVNRFKINDNKTQRLNLYDSQCYYKLNNKTNNKIAIENIDTNVIGPYDGISVLVHDKTYIKYKENTLKSLIEEINSQTNNTNIIRLISKGFSSAIDYYYLNNMLNSYRVNSQHFISEALSIINNAILQLTDEQVTDYSLHIEDDELLMLILTINLNDMIRNTSLFSDNLSIFINNHYPSIPLDVIKDIQNHYRNNIEKDLIYVHNIHQLNTQIASIDEYAKCLNISNIKKEPYNKNECGSLIVKEIDKVFNASLYSSVDKLKDNDIFSLPKNENEEKGTLDLLNEIGEDELNSNDTKEEANETLELSFSIPSKDKPKRLYRQDNQTTNTSVNFLESYHSLHNKTILFIESQVSQTENFITHISPEFKEYYVSIKNIITSLNKNFETDFPYKVKPELIEKKYEKLKQFIKLEKKILHKLFNATEIATKLIFTISNELNTTEQINNMSLLNLNRLSLYAIELKRIATKNNLNHFYIDIWVNLIEKILKIKDKEITDIKELNDINATINKVINETTVKNKFAVFNLIYKDVFKAYQKLYHNIEQLIQKDKETPSININTTSTKETVQTIKLNTTSSSKVINVTHSSAQIESKEEDDSFIGFLRRIFKPTTVIYSIVYFIICFILILFYLTFFKRIIYYTKIYLNNNGYDDSNISNKRKTFFVLLFTSFLFMVIGFVLYKDFLISLLFSINGIFIAASLLFEGQAGSRFGKISFAFLFFLLWVKFSLLNSQYEIWLKAVSFITAELVGVLSGALIGNISFFSFIKNIREAKERVDVISTNNIIDSNNQI